MRKLGDTLPELVQTFGTRKRGIPTGIFQVDELLNGLEPSDFIIVAARPSMGKTAYAGCVAIEASRTNKVAFFSLEMSYTRLAERMIANVAQVSHNQMVRNMLDSSGKRAQSQAVEQLMQHNLWIDDTPYLTTQELRGKIIEHEPELVIIDYLQLMTGERTEGRRQEVADMSRDLKLMTQEFSLPIVALCQLNRECERRDDTMPRMSDLREAGDLEQDADKIILLHRPAYYTMQATHDVTDDDAEARIIVAKNRHGPVGIVECAFMSEFVSFVDINEEEF